MAPFDDSAYEKRAKQLKDDQAKLEASRVRAKKLWDTHIEPLSHEDRETLRDLLHDYFHSHE